MGGERGSAAEEQPPPPVPAPQGAPSPSNQAALLLLLPLISLETSTGLGGWEARGGTGGAGLCPSCDGWLSRGGICLDGAMTHTTMLLLLLHLRKEMPSRGRGGGSPGQPGWSREGTGSRPPTTPGKSQIESPLEEDGNPGRPPGLISTQWRS